MNCHGFNFQKANSSNNFALATRSARGVAESSAPKEGVGNAGCPLHPQPRARLALVKMHTSKRVHRNRPAFPHAMVLTVSFVLSPVTGLFCHRHQRIKVLSKPGRADLTSANLTPASGRQDHTTSPYAATSLVRTLFDRSRAEARPATISRAKRCRVHRIPPYVRDDRDTPLWWGGMRKVLEVIWGGWKRKYFCKGDSTQKCPAGKSLEPLDQARRCLRVASSSVRRRMRP